MDMLLQSSPPKAICLAKLDSRLSAFAAFNLLERLLAFDPKSRPSAVAALNDEYLADYHHPLDEPSAQMPFHIEHEVRHAKGNPCFQPGS